MKRYLFTLLILCLSASSAFADVAHVADSNLIIDKTSGAPDNTSVTLTVAGGHSNNLIEATVFWVTGTATVSSVTWDPTGANQAFTSMGARINSAGLSLQKFYLVNPTAGASKAVKVIMSVAASAIGLVAAHFDGVDQVTPIRAATYDNTGSCGASSPCSLVVTSAVGDMTVSGLVTDSFSGSAPTTAFPPATLIGSGIDTGLGFSFGSDYATGAATNTHSWSGSFFSMTKSMGASLAASTGGGGGGVPVRHSV